MAKTAEHRIAILFISLFLQVTSLCSGEGSCIHMLLLIDCVYSDTMDIKATDRFMVESI